MALALWPETSVVVAVRWVSVTPTPRACSGSRAAGQRGWVRLLGERADLGPDAQIIDRAECMLAHESMPIDQDEAGRGAHFVALHGVGNRTRRIRLIERDRKLQAVFVDEGLEHRRVERVVMFERGVQADHRHILRLESLVNSLRLGNSAANRV